MEAIRLLIADDDPVLVDSLIKLVTLEPGVEVVGIAKDAQEAIRLAAELQPDVVLCDVSMPGGGGPAACVGIRASAPSTRVIAHSMYDDRGAVMHMVRAGAIGYVLKGSAREQIMFALDRARNGEASLSGQVASLVVSELSAHLRDQEREAESKRQDLAAVRRLATGEGLEVRFEPIADLVLGELVGVEATPFLQSTRDVEQATLESWVAVAASVGFGAELDLALAGVCLNRIDQAPPGAWIGINVAPSTLVDPAFAAILAQVVAFPVCLEVGDQTEADYVELRRALKTIRRPGITLAVDGLGTSGASLRQLSELQPDLVKLDPWVMQRYRRDGSTMLMERMARMVTDMGSQLIVCGVGDPAEIQVLRDVNVRFAQGPNVVAGVVEPATRPRVEPDDPPLALAQ